MMHDINKGLTEKMTFDQKLQGCKVAIYVDMWEGFPGR